MRFSLLRSLGPLRLACQPARKLAPLPIRMEAHVAATRIHGALRAGWQASLGLFHFDMMKPIQNPYAL